MFKILDEDAYGRENENRKKLQKEVAEHLETGWIICASGVYRSGRHWVHLLKDRNYHV